MAARNPVNRPASFRSSSRNIAISLSIVVSVLDCTTAGHVAARGVPRFCGLERVGNARADVSGVHGKIWEALKQRISCCGAKIGARGNRFLTAFSKAERASESSLYSVCFLRLFHWTFF